MSLENDVQSSVDKSAESVCEPKTLPRLSYTRDFLLSLSNLDVCKQLPSGFDPTILSEFEDALHGIQERQRVAGNMPLQGYRRNEYGSSPPTRGDSGNYSRGIYGRWDNRSSGRNERDSDSQSDRDSGAARVRDLPPDQFCRHGFVLGKASEAGFGNEMYKILTAAALSIMLNRSLIIGQSRGKYPFQDYISYSNVSFTLEEVKHLWRQKGCLTKYGRHLVIRIDDFQKPARTNVLCSNWKEWEQPIVWLQNTTDAVAAQFFLKNIYSEMRNAATDLFGQPENLQHRPNTFGELMKVLIAPSENVKEAVNWVLGDGVNPDISLHMRMLMNRSLRTAQAALNCLRKAMENLHLGSKPKVVLVSDTPSFVKEFSKNISELAEVLHFDYELFKGNISGADAGNNIDFRVKDWGPAPRWVAFVDFFLASRAKHAVVSGAHRRVGTTYAQLVAALAAACKLEENSSASWSFSFFSSFHSPLLSEGLGIQVGWGHVWNRFAGPLSCHNQSNQCAFTPLLPPAWWDGLWQSPIKRDVKRMQAYGIQLSGFGTSDDDYLHSFCFSRKNVVRTVPLI